MKLTIASILWLVISFLLFFGLMAILPPDILGISLKYLLMAVELVIAMYTASQISTIFTYLIFNKNLTRVINTHLPKSGGTITGSDYQLPTGITVTYSNATKSPVLTIYYNESEFVGIQIDFGNGVVSHTNHHHSIRNVSGNLKVSCRWPDGSTQSIR